MCIIIYGKKRIEQQFFRDAYKKNKDGIGLMWSANGELNTWVTLSFDQFLKAYEEVLALRTFPAIHFRAATIGNVCLDNCHPFLVNDNVGLMHNGTMKLGTTTSLAPKGNYYSSAWNDDYDYNYTGKPAKVAIKTKTDSEEFAELLDELSWEDYELLDKKIFATMLNGSRVLLMNQDGDVKIINRYSPLAIEEDGVWYSKNNVHKNINVFVYGSLKKGFGNHKGHLDTERFVKNVTIEGFDMYSLSAYPAVVDGEGTIHGEMYRVDADAFKALDRLEGYPSHYNRKLVKSTCGEEAWIYYYKTAPVSRKKVESGIWEQPTYTYKPTPYVKPKRKEKSRDEFVSETKRMVTYEVGYKALSEEEKEKMFNIILELSILEYDDRFDKAKDNHMDYYGHSYYGKDAGTNGKYSWQQTTKQYRLDYLKDYYAKMEIPKLAAIVKAQREPTEEESEMIWEMAEKACEHMTGSGYTQKLMEKYDEIARDIISKEEEAKELKKDKAEEVKEEIDIWAAAEQVIFNRWVYDGKASTERDTIDNKDFWDEVAELVMNAEAAEYINAVSEIEEVPDFNDPFYFSE